jgi:hypothetical protein
MPGRTITALLLTVALLACGADGKEKTADKDKTADKKDASKKDEKPACMHCGATCGLVPICVCESGTKKKPKVEFDVTCEPICVAGCGSKPWPFGRCNDRVGCTSCCEEPCRCPGWVRNCKKLKKEATDEEVPTIKRKVAYVCDCCAGRCTAGCCGGGRARRAPTWWACLTSWMTPAPSR